MNVHGMKLTLIGMLVSGAAHAAGDTEELERALSTPVYAASKYQQAMADVPAAATVLTQGEIRAFGWRTLADIVAAARGIYTRYDRNYTYIGVRGLGRPGDYSSRLLVLVDGVRLNDNIYDSVLAGREFPLDVELIERVEFIPGPGSAVYGGNAVLGTVNVVTRTSSSLRGRQVMAGLDTQHGVKAVVSATIESHVGSFLGAISVEDRPGQTLAFPEFDSPSTPGGVIRGRDGEQAQRVYLQLRRESWTWSALAGRRAKEIPNAPYGLVFGDPAADWVDALGAVGLTWHPEMHDGEGWNGQIGLGRYTYSSNGRYEPDRHLGAYDNYGLWFHGELSRTVRVGASSLVLLGIDMQRDQQQRISARVLEPVVQPAELLATRDTRLGLYASDNITISRALMLGLGVRLDRSNHEGWTGSPRASLLWHPQKNIVVKALAGRAFRSPNVYERAGVDPGEAWIDGLQRERVTSHELAMEWQADERVRIGASVYQNNVTRVIEQVVDESTAELVYRNVGSARAEGVELEVEGRTQGGLRARASVSRQRSRDAVGTELSNSPRWLSKLHATAPMGDSPFRLALEILGESARISETGRNISSRLQANISLNWSPPAGRWSASLSVYNALDRREFDPTGTEFLADRVEQDGREASLRVYLTF